MGYLPNNQTTVYVNIDTQIGEHSTPNLNLFFNLLDLAEFFKYYVINWSMLLLIHNLRVICFSEFR